jgi:hypothetical protein
MKVVNQGGGRGGRNSKLEHIPPLRDSKSPQKQEKERGGGEEENNEHTV